MLDVSRQHRLEDDQVSCEPVVLRRGDTHTHTHALNMTDKVRCRVLIRTSDLGKRSNWDLRLRNLGFRVAV